MSYKLSSKHGVLVLVEIMVQINASYNWFAKQLLKWSSSPSVVVVVFAAGFFRDVVEEADAAHFLGFPFGGFPPSSPLPPLSIPPATVHTPCGWMLFTWIQFLPVVVDLTDTLQYHPLILMLILSPVVVDPGPRLKKHLLGNSLKKELHICTYSREKLPGNPKKNNSHGILPSRLEPTKDESNVSQYAHYVQESWLQRQHGSSRAPLTLHVTHAREGSCQLN